MVYTKNMTALQGLSNPRPPTLNLSDASSLVWPASPRLYVHSDIVRLRSSIFWTSRSPSMTSFDVGQNLNQRITLRILWLSPPLYSSRARRELHDRKTTQQTRDIESLLGWCWADVVDGWPTSTQQWFNVSCLLGNYFSIALQLCLFFFFWKLIYFL